MVPTAEQVHNESHKEVNLSFSGAANTVIQDLEPLSAQG